MKNNPHFLQAMLNKRMLICIFTGFSSGLPLYILFSLLPAWLKTEGASLKDIAEFALFSLPLTLKFIWAPLFDRFTPPLGRRRGWLILTQVGLLISLPLFGAFHPALDIRNIAYLCFWVAFLAASQDVVIDAYRRELLPDHELGLGNAVHVNAYKIASLVPGSLSLILSDHMAWSSVFMITALFMLPGMIMTLLISEPVLKKTTPITFRAAVIEPFQEFVGRNGLKSALTVLLFIFLYKLGDSMATALATPFYLEMGFSKTEIGLVAKHASLWPSVVGGILGGIWMMRLGINRALWIFGAVQMIAILGFAWLATVGHSLPWLALVIGLEALSVGLGTAAFVAYIAHTTNPLYTATQFALFTSLAAVPRTFVNAATGYLVDYFGWVQFFVLCFVLAIPGMLLLLKVAPWNATPSTRLNENV
jgi:PAT family beta-lactamase induction signal transducer AmpG